jgi:hypothetical protein
MGSEFRISDFILGRFWNLKKGGATMGNTFKDQKGKKGKKDGKKK